MYYSHLQGHLKSDHLKPVYVAYGNNTFEIYEAVSQLKARAARDGDPTLSVVEFGKDRRELGDVTDVLLSVPMFVDSRMVILREAGEFINRHRKALEKYLDKPSPTAVLVMTVERWNRKTKLARRVESLGGDIACWVPRRESDLIGWIQSRARSSCNKQISPAAAQLLADLCQGELSGIAAELAKLDLYVGQATAITAEDVAAAGMGFQAYSPFDLCDKLADGDREAALQVVESLLAEGLPPVVLIGTLRSTFRRLLEARLMAESEGMAAAVAKFSWNPRDRDSFRRRLERFSADRLVKAHRRLLRADLEVKTSRYPNRLIVERLLLDLSREGTRPVGQEVMP